MRGKMPARGSKRKRFLTAVVCFFFPFFSQLHPYPNPTIFFPWYDGAGAHLGDELQARSDQYHKSLRSQGRHRSKDLTSAQIAFLSRLIILKEILYSQIK